MSNTCFLALKLNMKLITKVTQPLTFNPLYLPVTFAILLYSKITNFHTKWTQNVSFSAFRTVAATKLSHPCCRLSITAS